MNCNTVANSSNVGRLLKSEAFKDEKVGVFHMTNIFKGEDYVELQVYGEDSPDVVNIPSDKLDDVIAALGVVNAQIKKGEDGLNGN